MALSCEPQTAQGPDPWLPAACRLLTPQWTPHLGRGADATLPVWLPVCPSARLRPAILPSCHPAIPLPRVAPVSALRALGPRAHKSCAHASDKGWIDVVLKQSRDRGATWSATKIVHSEFEASPGTWIGVT